MSDRTDATDFGGGDDAEDEALLTELRALARLHDPVPPEAIAGARSAIAWRTMDAELAELTEDSSMEPRPAGVRSTDTPTMLSFEGREVGVEVEVLAAGSGRRLVGQLVPHGPAEIDIRYPGGSITVQADDIGRFRADGVPSGPLSLRCVVDDRVVETDWFLA